MRARLGLLLFVVIATVLVACSAKPTFVGTWTGTSANGATTITFNADGTYVQDATIPLPTGQNQALKVSGGYVASEENKKLSLSVTNIDMPGAPAAFLAFAKPLLEKQKKEKIEATVEWLATDEIKVAMAGQSTTLKRTK